MTAPLNLASLPPSVRAAAERAQPQEVRLVVPGVAQPAGSKRSLVPLDKRGNPYRRPGGGVVVSTTDDNPKSRQWKETVASAALAAGVRPLEGPLHLRVIFVQTRPKGHYGSGRNASEIRPSAPAWPAVKPDLTKLTRGLEDGLRGIAYRDDAQIVEHATAKVYGEPARVEVVLTRMAQQTVGDAA